MIKLRQAQLDDLPTLLVFEQALIAYERPFTPLLKADPISYYDIEGYIKSPNVEVVVAIVDNQLVGSGYALIKTAEPYKTPEQYAYLGFMYVIPEYRGKGINQKIMNHLFDWIKQQGISEIQLEVYAQNESALKAYAKIGFIPNLISMRLKN